MSATSARSSFPPDRCARTRLHTPTLRTLAAALGLSGRPEEAREAMARLRAARAGADGYGVARALSGARQPASRRVSSARWWTPGCRRSRARRRSRRRRKSRGMPAISVGEGTSPRNTSARIALSTGTERDHRARALGAELANGVVQRDEGRRSRSARLARGPARPTRAAATRQSGAGADQRVPRDHDERRIERNDGRTLDRAHAPGAQLQHVKRAEGRSSEEHRVAERARRHVALGGAPPRERQDAAWRTALRQRSRGAKGVSRRRRTRAGQPRPG